MLARFVTLTAAAIAALAGAGPEASVPDCRTVAGIPASTSAADLAEALDLLQRLGPAGAGCEHLGPATRRVADGLFAIGEYRGASRACALLRSFGPLSPQDLLACARPLAALGELAEARALLDAYVAAAGRGEARARALLEAAGVMEAAARFSVAADLLREAASSAPADPAIAVHLVRSLLQAGRPAEAAAAAEAGASRAGDAMGRVLREACWLLIRFHEPARARTLAARLAGLPGLTIEDLDAVAAVAEAADEPDLARRAASRYAEQGGVAALREAAGTLERHALVAVAGDFLAAAIARSGDKANADDLARLGRLELLAGRTDEAAGAFSDYIRACDDRAEAFIRVAEEWTRARMPERAIAVLREAIARGIEPPEVVVALGRALAGNGDEKAEAALYAAAAARSREPAALWMRIAEDLLARSRPAQAESAWRAAVSAATTPSQRGLALAGVAEAVLAADRRARDKAEETLLAALEVAGDDPRVLDRVGRIAERMGASGTLSLAVLERSVRRDPGRPELWSRLARAYVAGRRRHDATAAYARFVAASSDRKAALGEALEAMFRERWYGEGLRLLREEGGGEPPTPALAEAAGQACIAVADRRCATRYLSQFIAAPVQLDYDYLGLGTLAGDSRLWPVAEKALEVARRVRGKDREWEVDLAAGRVALLRGDMDAAEALFRRAVDAAPQRRPTLLRVAREYQQVGRLGAAASWYQAAMKESDPTYRTQVFPALAEVLWRAGRGAEVRQALSLLAGASWRNSTLLRTAAGQLVAAGLREEAAALLESNLDAAGGRERAELRAMLVGLLLASGRAGDALRVAEVPCAGPAGVGADNECLAATRELVEGLRPDLAAAVLERRVAGGAGPSIEAHLAVMLLRLGRRADALEAAARAAERVAAPSEIITTVGVALADMRAWDDWAALIQRMVTRPQFTGEPDLLLEAARVHLATGNVPGAMLALQAFIGVSRAGEVTAFRELVAAGAWEEAARVIDGAPPSAIAAAEPGELRDVIDALLVSGRTELARVVIERYRAGNERSAAAEQVVGRLLEDLGRHAEAVAAFRAAGEAKMAGPERVAFVKALWAAGMRAEALDVAIRGVRGPEGGQGERAPEPWVNELAEFFVAEDAIGEALAFLDRVDREFGLAPQVRLIRARLLARSGRPEAQAAGRVTFVEAVSELAALPEAGLEYIRTEAAAGTLPGLRQALAAGGDGRAVQAARLAVACLSGEGAGAEAGALAGPAADPDPDGMRIAAEVLFECGRWAAARDMALKALGSYKADVDDPTPLARIALVAGRMAGGGADIAALDELTRARTDDVTRRLARGVSLRLAAGDYAGAATMALTSAHAAPADSQAWFTAVETAMWAGDDRQRAEAERLAVENSDDRAGALARVADLYRRYLRDDLSIAPIRSLAAAFPGDRQLRWRIVEATTRAGQWEEARAAAKAYVAAVPDRRSAALDVVGLAAGQLSVDLAGAHLAEALDGPRSAAAARAAVQVAILHFRSGRPDEALAMVRRAVAIAPHPLEAISLVAQAALVDPVVPIGAIDAAVASMPAGGRDPGTLPYVVAARCTASVADDASARACAAAIGDAGYLPGSVLMAGAYRALAEGRDAAAELLLRELIAAEPGRGARLHVAGRVMSYLGCGTTADPKTRKVLGRLGRSLVEPAAPVIPDSGTLALRAHLLEMTDGLAAAVELYEREIALAPAEATLRNNLAYLLSTCRGDMSRAVREARAAGVLRSQGNGFYIETEAWAEFLAGRVKEAMALQERARRLWNIEQGGGMSESLHHLGRMLEAAGRKAEAIEVLRRAATIEPGEWDGREALARWRALSM